MKYNKIKIIIFLAIVINILISCKKPYNNISETNNMNVDTITEEVNTSENNSANDNNINDQISQEFLNISSKVQPGTAGTSLKATSFLSNILNIIYENKNVDTEIIISKIQNNINKNDDNFKFEFEESIQSIKSLLDMLIDENSEELLDAAGVENSYYPWDIETFDIVKDIIDDNIWE